MENKNIEYKEGIVTFLDILGFGNILREKSAQSIYDMLVSLHEKAVEQVTTIAEKYSQKYDIHILSDCIIKSYDLSRPQDDRYAAISLQHEFMTSAILQGQLIYYHDSFLRGGITYGNYFASKEKSVLFGPAVADAYKIESQSAIYPRICIDPSVLQALHEKLLPQYPFGLTEDGVSAGSEEAVVKHLYSWITKGDDGVWFVDYLSSFRLWFPHDRDPREFIVKHKKAIEEVLYLKEISLSDTILLKYLWLAKYHNRTVGNWSNVGTTWVNAGTGKPIDEFDPSELTVSIPGEYR